jgi:hypothetical protein
MWLAKLFPSVRRALKENAELRAELDLMRFRATPIPKPPPELVAMVDRFEREQVRVTYSESEIHGLMQEAGLKILHVQSERSLLADDNDGPFVDS